MLTVLWGMGKKKSFLSSKCLKVQNENSRFLCYLLIPRWLMSESLSSSGNHFWEALLVLPPFLPCTGWLHSRSAISFFDGLAEIFTNLISDSVTEVLEHHTPHSDILIVNRWRPWLWRWNPSGKAKRALLVPQWTDSSLRREGRGKLS